MFRLPLILIISVLLIVPVYSIAKPDQVLCGVMNIYEAGHKGKPKTEQVNFAISDDYARIDASSKVYYLINLDNEITFVVNNKRKTVTRTYASSILDQPLPPLVILKNRASLKKYLTTTNAHLDNVLEKGLNKYEVWTFTVDKILYKVQIKLPDYFPEEVEIVSPEKKVIITVLESTRKPYEDFGPDFFNKPEQFNIVDLIGE